MEAMDTMEGHETTLRAIDCLRILRRATEHYLQPLRALKQQKEPRRAMEGHGGPWRAMKHH